MTRKDISKEFLRLCATGKVRDAYERFAAANFRHHNPYFRGDADSLRKAMEEAAAKFPFTRIETKHIFEEGDRVAVHSRVQHAPGDSPNQHGLF